MKLSKPLKHGYLTSKELQLPECLKQFLPVCVFPLHACNMKAEKKCLEAQNERSFKQQSSLQHFCCSIEVDRFAEGADGPSPSCKASLEAGDGRRLQTPSLYHPMNHKMLSSHFRQPSPKRNNSTDTAFTLNQIYKFIDLQTYNPTYIQTHKDIH